MGKIIQRKIEVEWTQEALDEEYKEVKTNENGEEKEAKKTYYEIIFKWDYWKDKRIS